MRRRILVVDVVQWTVTASPGFQLRPPNRPQHDAGRVGADHVEVGAWGAPRFSLPSRSRNPNVGSGSKMEVQTVLK